MLAEDADLDNVVRHDIQSRCFEINEEKQRVFDASGLRVEKLQMYRAEAATVPHRFTYKTAVRILHVGLGSDGTSLSGPRKAATLHRRTFHARAFVHG